MTDLGVLGRDVETKPRLCGADQHGSAGGRIPAYGIEICPAGRAAGAGMAAQAILVTRAPQKPACPSGVVIGMAGEARVRTQGLIGEVLHIRIGGGMDARAPARQRIGLVLHYAIGVVAGKAHSSVGAILRKKILGSQILGLHVRVMTRRAFDIATNQLDRAGWVGGLPLRRQRRNQVGSVYDRQHQTERMRRLEVRAEHIGRVHRPGRRYFAGDNRLPHSYGPVVAAEAQAAVRAQHGLRPSLVVGGAGI